MWRPRWLHMGVANAKYRMAERPLSTGVLQSPSLFVHVITPTTAVSGWGFMDLPTSICSHQVRTGLLGICLVFLFASFLPLLFPPTKKKETIRTLSSFHSSLSSILKSPHPPHTLILTSPLPSPFPPPLLHSSISFIIMAGSFGTVCGLTLVAFLTHHSLLRSTLMFCLVQIVTANAILTDNLLVLIHYLCTLPLPREYKR